jgi:hypothetical protein
MSESASEWVNRVGPTAARLNEDSRREHEQFQAQRLAEIRDALDIVTFDLDGSTQDDVLKLAQALVARLTCEAWGRKMGWDTPRHGTPAWLELYTAWLGSGDED